MSDKIIYLDNAASSRVYPEVIREMSRVMSQDYGNPSSLHSMGEKAREEIDNARKVLAKEINAKPWEIIFTSGGTEAINLAFFGLASGGKKKIIISAIEHPCTYEICDVLKKKGFKIVEIPVNKAGLLDLAALEKEIDSSTLLVSVIHANNEIGVVQNLDQIGYLCGLKKVPLHVDALQSYGKENIDVKKCNISLLSAGAHKIGGPKGVGFLYVKEGLEINPMIYGGGQEKGMRGGTENVPGIVGFAKALEMTKRIDREKIREVRDYFIHQMEGFGAKINGSRKDRSYNNVSASLDMDAESAVISLSRKGIMCSTGSACESKKQKESKVLKAIGLSSKDIAGTLRFSLDEKTSKKDVDYVIEQLRKLK
ncbi:MAG: cysteine desulfurase family protein [archaeon]